MVQAFGVGDVARSGGQGLADLHCASNRRSAGGWRVGRGGHCRRFGAGQLLFVAFVVAEGDPDLDRLALFGVGQGVGAGGGARDLGIVGEPLIGVGHVVQAFGVGDRAGAGGQSLTDLRCAGDRRIARGRRVGRGPGEGQQEPVARADAGQDGAFGRRHVEVHIVAAG